MRFRLASLLALASASLVAALVPGCSGPAATCSPSCAPGYVCTAGVCTPSAGRDASVAEDMLTGTCAPACGGGTPFCDGTNRCVACRADGDCPLGRVCKAGADGKAACLPGCADDSRCRAGATDPSGASCCGGACVDTASDVSNCGACGKSCSAIHASTACVHGQCSGGACDDGWGDCNQDPKDGCEASLRVDPANCGACGAACVFPNATAGCASHGADADGGTDGCYISACHFGFDDCNNDLGDGCETSVLSDANNCGACGSPCKLLPNAKVTCANAVCALTGCASGYANCDGDVQNGCESNVASDAKNCGSCGRVCPAGLVCAAGLCTCPQCNIPNASSMCVNNVCVLAQCNPGFADCDKNAANGCEVGLHFDKNNCGACGSACPMNKPYCIAGACSATGNRVLLVFASSYAPDVKQVLDQTGAFTVVDSFDASAGTPTLAQLQMYDAILVFSDSSFRDNVALGDVVADFFDAGGRVVIATFANASVPIAGRFGQVGNGYVLINPSGQEEPMDSLGTILEPQSPLVQGVTRLSAQAAFRSTGLAINGGVVVAQWASGKPLIVRGVVKNRNRVDLNMYPPSTAIRMDFWAGDGGNILRNALLFQ